MIDAAALESVPFAEDAMLRRVHREGVLLLGGGRALLLQIAHPGVARGVAEHSSFREDSRGRLLRTLRPMFAIAFGTREQALAAAGVNGRHAGVRGAGYAANDPELLLWVLATLLATTLLMHALLLRPLAPPAVEAYYEDMTRVGGLLGLDRTVMPPDAAAFRRYFAATLDSLSVSDTARALLPAIFDARTLGPFTPAARQLTVGLLPPRLREQFGLGWGPGRETALRLAWPALRGVVRLTPRRLRRPPWFLMPPPA